MPGAEYGTRRLTRWRWPTSGGSSPSANSPAASRHTAHRTPHTASWRSRASADADRARTGEKPEVALGPRRLGPTLGFLGYSLRKNGLRTRHVGEVTEIGDGDVLDLPGSPLIVGMPGHSPGSVAVHVPLADAVAVGDALTTRHVLTGRTGPQPAPFTDDPALALSSLDRIAGLPASWVLPGHGAPWRTSPARVGEAVRSAADADRP
ncbi:MBL fold metallo-hydrolase [Kitasatospora sp. NRRL B-11411]|uniref:MBL fold metallo-hydrolase n=1 Tax=Kitasatospora sp. NRRL B-11411 TaxID=1463822 RepID=UPI0009E06F76|nr:MBL fold metallo-hydrolase [Kitasatospora sp. NRRL B-11411]